MYKKTLIMSTIVGLTAFSSQVALAAPSSLTETNLTSTEDSQKVLNKIKINKEKKDFTEVFKVLTSNSSVSEDDYVWYYNKDLFTEFVPEGVTIGEVVVTKDNNALTIDYNKNQLRTTVTYYQDGAIRKTVGSNGIVESNFNDKIGSEYNNKDVITKKRTQQELEKINQLLKEKKFKEIESMPDTKVEIINNIPTVSFDEGAITPSANNVTIRSLGAVTLAAAATNVIPMPSDPTFQKRYTAKQVYGTSFVSQPLKNLGYSGNSYVRVYETLNAFTQVDFSASPFKAGTAIDVISNAWGVARSTSIAWMSWYGIVKTVIDTINADMVAVTQNSYDFQGGKEATVEDPITYNNKQVEVVQYWGKGRLTLGWQYDSSSGYKNASWSHTTQSSALQMANATVGSNGVNNYNSNITARGYWMHGLGQLGY